MMQPRTSSFARSARRRAMQRAFAGILLASSMSGCGLEALAGRTPQTAREPAVGAVRISLPVYSAAFQTQLADELAGVGPVCDRMEPAPGCSALRTVALDLDLQLRRERMAHR